MLKKSTVVLLSYSSLQGVNRPAFVSTSSCQSNTTARQKPLARPQRNQLRAYEMANGYSKHQHKNLPWPEVTSANVIPTPYQIFDQKKGSPYSKRRFYELVKMYHPDRHNIDGVSDGLPYATKLERYRLIIAANEILSDPVKRGAYDCYGAGWNGLPGVKSPRDSPETVGVWDTNSGRGWGEDPEGPSQNATWEDWERWYQRGEKAKQQPTYFSNGTFLSLIIIFVALGGVGQATRAEKRSMSIQEQRLTIHRGISKDLVHRRNGSAISGDPRERMYNFLRLRGPYNQYLVDPQEKMLLTQPETCSSTMANTLPINMHHREDKLKAQ